MLRQPPYGDRAIVLKSTGKLIGSCGYVPCLNAFEQLSGFTAEQPLDKPTRYTAEFGLFYAISPPHRRHGYAAEANRALIDYAFEYLKLKRLCLFLNEMLLQENSFIQHPMRFIKSDCLQIIRHGGD